MPEISTQTAFLRYELKLTLSPDEASQVAAWASRRFHSDAFAGPGGEYLITSLYLDTRALQPYHRVLEPRGTKYRIRRYGSETVVYLERKRRKKELVKKRRGMWPLGQLDAILRNPVGLSGWSRQFRAQIEEHDLRPTLLVAYDRAAWAGNARERLTLDRNIRAWKASKIQGLEGQGQPARVSDAVVLELKYDGTIPPLFREALELLGRDSEGFSKYTHGLDAVGLAVSQSTRPNA